MILVDWVLGFERFATVFGRCEGGFERDTPLPMRKRKVDDQKG